MTDSQKSELAEEIGLLIDKAENFHGASQLQMPAAIHAECLAGGMKDIATKLHEIREKYL